MLLFMIKLSYSNALQLKSYHVMQRSNLKQQAINYNYESANKLVTLNDKDEMVSTSNCHFLSITQSNHWESYLFGWSHCLYVI